MRFQVTFAGVDGALDAWNRHLPGISTWTARIFFVAIGLVVPVQEVQKRLGLAHFLHSHFSFIKTMFSDYHSFPAFPEIFSW
jgi:hypothetical protein